MSRWDNDFQETKGNGRQNREGLLYEEHPGRTSPPPASLPSLNDFHIPASRYGPPPSRSAPSFRRSREYQKDSYAPSKPGMRDSYVPSKSQSSSASPSSFAHAPKYSSKDSYIPGGEDSYRPAAPIRSRKLRHFKDSYRPSDSYRLGDGDSSPRSHTLRVETFRSSPSKNSESLPQPWIEDSSLKTNGQSTEKPDQTSGNIWHVFWENSSTNFDVAEGDGLFTKQNHKYNPFTFEVAYPEAGLVSTKKVNYKVMYDPELKKDSKKGNAIIYRFKGEGVQQPLKDPRIPVKHNYAKYCLTKKSKHTQYKALVVPTFQYDKNSVGQPPSSEIVVWNFHSNFSSKIIKSNFETFGKVLEVEMISDPISATPLGVCRLKFDDNDGKLYGEANKSAMNAIKEANNKLILSGCRVKVGLNTKHNGLLEERRNKAITLFQERRKHQQKIHEQEMAKQKERELQRKKLELKKRAEQLEEEKRVKLKRLTALNPQISKNAMNGSSSQDIFLPALFFGAQDTNKAKTNESKSGKIQIPQHIIDVINSRPFLFLSDKYYPTRLYQVRNLKAKLSKYDWTKILAEPNLGFFILFNNKKAAVHCYNEQNGKILHKGKATFELCLDNKSYEQKHLYNKEPVEEAVDQIWKDLESMLRKDIKERTIGPSVLSMLNPDNFSGLVVREEAHKLGAPPTAITETTSASCTSTPKPEEHNEAPSNDVFGIGNTNHLPQLKLPSFRKKSEEKSKKAKQKNKLRTVDITGKFSTKKYQHATMPLNRMLNDDNDEEGEGEEEDVNLETPDSLKDQESPVKKDVQAKKKLKYDHKRSMAFYSSSEDEGEEDDELVHKSKHTAVETKESVEDHLTTPVTPENELDKKMEIDDVPTLAEKLQEFKKEKPSVGEQRLEDEDKDEHKQEDDLSNYEQIYKPDFDFVKTVYPETAINSPLDLSTFKSLIRDEEDLSLMKEVFKEVSPSQDIQNTEYWCWRKNETYEAQHSDVEEEDQIKVDTEIAKALENTTGSFRSEGYRKILDSLKAEYLPHRRKVHRHEPLNTLKNDSAEATGTAIQSSRVNRANNRRLAADTKQILGSETDILKLNSLNKRKKPVNFARSAIHNWGLYALEPIAANEMIIEYVGDSIRQQVAELREKQYLKSGIGSSYLFRIDDQTVIDATKKGGIARFINHCCTPSCTAKIIKVEGKKRIVIYALKDIKANEELTYDYKFERETNDEERIACLCGAPGCKGFLN